MAFTGSATVKQITDRMVRITGLSLASGANGTIGLAGSTNSPGVTLPASFKTQHYAYDGSAVSFQDAIHCTLQNADTGVATAIPLSVVKTGSNVHDFLITITNTHGSIACADQEIIVQYHE
jgi:hypothetical protein